MHHWILELFIQIYVRKKKLCKNFVFCVLSSKVKSEVDYLPLWKGHEIRWNEQLYWRYQLVISDPFESCAWFSVFENFISAPITGKSEVTATEAQPLERATLGHNMRQIRSYFHTIPPYSTPGHFSVISRENTGIPQCGFEIFSKFLQFNGLKKNSQTP